MQGLAYWVLCICFLSEIRVQIMGMSQQKALAIIAAILTTIYELSPDESVPASPIYMALGMDINLYHTLTDVMVKANLIVKTNETLALTDIGRDKAIALALSQSIGH